MPCLRKQTLVKLFFNFTCITAKFFFLFFYHICLFSVKLIIFFFRSHDEYEDDIVFEEDETMPELEEDDDQEYRYSYVKGDHFVAEIINDGEKPNFYPKELHNNDDVTDHDDDLHHDNINNNNPSQLHSNLNSSSSSSSYDSLFQDPVEEFDDDGDKEAAFDLENSTISSEVHHLYDNDIGQQVDYEVINEDQTATNLESMQDYKSCESKKRENTYNKSSHNNIVDSHPVCDVMPRRKSQSVELFNQVGSQMNVAESNNHHGETVEKKMEVQKEDTNFTRDENFLIFQPPKSEARKMQGIVEENQVIFEDTYTIGSTSKSSSDWRSSLRDSGTDDPFSSSSRRSCPKWESYAVYQKYDEEMMFLDRVSAQKLHETESLKSFQVEPRSISQRIVHKLANKNKKKSEDDAIYKNNNNPYNELEVAYVAQICLAWETLNWNYANFHRKQVSRSESLDPGCPALIAQQFQQFQVLLQRYNESEPYERGKRPEIYTRMRSVAPKLLQVPEYHDYGEEQEVVGGRITSALFLQILEDAIQTFMNFLRADRETHCELITGLFKQRPRRLMDPNVIKVFNKQLKKKKLKIREIQRSRIRICFKKKKLTKVEEMEILMGLVDIKVVSRVLRMADITKEQLHWCEAKMGKLRLLDGKLHRDSSTLFFPAH